MPADAIRGIVPFDMAGDGVVVQFKNSDLVNLQTKYGAEWLTSAIDNLNVADLPYLLLLIELGVKKDGKPFKVDFDEIDKPIIDIYETMVDGLFMATHGRTLKGHIEYVSERADELQDSEDNPPVPAP